jgi:hypothetical protein
MTSIAVEPSVPAAPDASRRVSTAPWRRLLFLLMLAVTAFGPQMLATGRAISEGSATAYLLVVPLLGILMAVGGSGMPRGVIDSESDWIVAGLIAGGGLLALSLITRRMPTLTSFWHIDQVAVVLFLYASSILIFSARHVLRNSAAWIFVVLCAPVVPYLLLTATLGGPPTGAVAVASALGSVAVFWSDRAARRPLRTVAAGVNFALALGVDYLMTGQDLALRVAVTAGLIPVLSTAVLRWSARLNTGRPVVYAPPGRPQRRVWAFPVLFAAALGLLVASLPLRPTPAAPEVRSDWTTAAGLQPTATLDFIARFAGPGATLTRYRLPSGTGEYAVAIDVITAPNLARLRDYDDAIWYPTTVPVEYHDTSLPGPVAVAARTVHTNADRTATNQDGHWHALTWLWRTTEAYQRVTVVASQTKGQSEPPPPHALTLRNSLIEPLLWVIRQQPDAPGVVAPEVRDTADSVAAQIVASATAA